MTREEGSLEDLLAFLRPDETAEQLLSRTQVEQKMTNVPFIDNHLVMRPGRALEIAGPAGSGKTELLLQLCVNCILPESYLGIHYGGWEGVALFVDLDGRFQSSRLRKILEARLYHANQVQTGMKTTPKGLDKSCLQRFHLVQCNSSFQFLAVLRLLGQTLEQLQEIGSPKLITVDNISAFYWMDRANHVVSRDVPPSNRRVPLTVQDGQRSVAQHLQAIGRKFNLCLVVSVLASVTVSWETCEEEEEDPGQWTKWKKGGYLDHALKKLLHQQLLLVPLSQLPEGLVLPGHTEGIAAYWTVPPSRRIYTFQVTDGIPQYA